MKKEGDNRIKFNRKYIVINPDNAVGPPTYIVDTSQTPPVDPCPPTIDPR